jgi:flagellar biosynthesis protein FliQ
VLALVLFGPWMLQKLINYTTAIFEAIPGVTR